MAATLFSTLLGLAREIVNARYYGTRWEMDTFLAAATIPTILFGLFNGALVSALVPVFSEYIAIERNEEGWRLANTVVNALVVLLVVVAAVAWIFAPMYVPLIAHGFPAPQMGVAIRMTRWLVPTIVATSLAGVFAAILNAHHRFRATALQGVAINVVTIACVIALDHRYGIYAVVLGTTLGFCAQVLVQIPALLRLGHWRPQIDLRHPGLARIAANLGPIIVGSAAGQLALFFDRFFASTLPPGAMAAMNYATKLVGFPQQIFAAAIATVIFPLLSIDFARGNRAGVRRSALTGLRLTLFITIPAVCGLYALAGPIVQTLFERGVFGAAATAQCVALIPYAAAGLVFVAANVILTRCCFACSQTSQPVTISVVSVMANVFLSVLWLPWLGARGLLLANSVSQGLQAIALGVVVWRLLDGLDLRTLGLSAGRAIVCSAAMVIALHWIGSVAAPPPAELLPRLWYLAGQLAIGGAVFFATARFIGADDLDIAVQSVMRKFSQNVPSAPEGRSVPIA